jgi:hypothetical protein
MAIKGDDRIDAYIAGQAEWAQPILRRLRELIHAADPNVVETIKWGAPAFEHKGILALFGAMKNHAFFSLWKGELIPGLRERYGERFGESMGSLGKIRTLDDLPPDADLIGWIRQAVVLNETGVKLPQRAKSEPRPVLETPDDLMAALNQNEAAQSTYEVFSPSKKREYVEWLIEARTEATRQRRLAQAIEWMAEGKSRMWKYERKP